jgi:hypothetical protein
VDANLNAWVLQSVMKMENDPRLQAFYDDLFDIGFWDIYFEIWRCLRTYGEWPLNEDDE